MISKIIFKNYKKSIIVFLNCCLLYIIYSIDLIYGQNYKINHNIVDIRDLSHKNKLMNHIKEDITLVTGYFKIKSKHSYTNYLDWINNFLQINHSIIFFIDSSIYKEFINKRPSEYQYKTLWVKTDIMDFYSYKNFFNDFNQTYELDSEKIFHNVLLYIVWAEKINFLKKVILKNYFKSKCFYWVDSGSFRNNITIKNFINDWPSPKKCYEDGRVIMNEVEIPFQEEKKN